MTKKERSVSLYNGYLKRVNVTKEGTNEEADTDVFKLMKFFRDELIWNRNEPINAYMAREDLTYVLKIDDINEIEQDNPNSGYIRGQFAAINSNVIPQYEWNGDIGSVQLPNESAGLYYPSHFVYFARRKHLVVEFNQSGPQTGMMGAYIEEKAALASQNLLNSAFFQEIFRADIIQTLQSMGSIAELFVEVQGNSLDILRNSPMAGVLNLESDVITEDSVVKLAISREKRASSGAALPKNPVVEWLRQHKILPSTMKLRARVEDRPDDSGASIWLDLVSASFKEKIRVDMNRNKSVNSQDCYEQLHLAYARMVPQG